MKILIIGLGSIGKKHVDAIISVKPDANIFALRSAKTEDVYKNVENIYPGDSLPNTVDFVIISNVTSMHEATILEMLHYKCPLFIEKPVLASLNKADEILKKIETENILTYVACNIRFHPAIIFIKNYLATNKPRINEVNIYCGSYLPDWRPNRDFKIVYSANKEMGGGVHLDLIHEIDYCSWLFGFPESYVASKQSVSSLAISSIDSANYHLRYNEFAVSITLNYYRKDARRILEILTSDDTLTVDLIENSVKSNLSGNLLFQSEMKIEDTYRDQIRYFIDKVSSKEQPMNSFNNALKVLQIAIHE